MTGVDLVSPGYFTHLGVPLIEGREFSTTDGPDAPMVAVVNQAFVRARVTSTPTVGQLISLGGTREAANTRIIGVVADVRDGNPGEAPKPTVYKAFAQAAPQISWHTLPITLRTDVTSGPVLDAVRATVSRWLPGTTIYDVQTMEARIG